MQEIRAQEIVKDYGGVRALAGVDVEISAGELFFLLGPSGCGKTTLLRCIAGLENPTSGRVFFGQKDVTTLPPHKREAAMVFQSYALWPHLTVGQNIAFGLEERKVPRNEIKRRVQEALNAVHLEGFDGRSIDQMSGGQQQRVALARALVVRPRCLLLDEPLSNLDARLRIEMRREIRRIVKDNGLTAIYVTHDQEEALAMADRLAVMERGKIAQVGTPEEVYRHPVNREVAAFMGETNFIEPARIDGGEDGLLKIQVNDLRWKARGGGGSGESVCLSLRPEAWVIGGTGENRLTGRVRERVYLGQRIQYWVETAHGVQQVVALNPQQLASVGENVEIAAAAMDTIALPIEENPGNRTGSI